MNTSDGQFRRRVQTQQCSVCILFFGIFLTFTGSALTAVGNASGFQSDFFESSHRPMRIIGPILLAIGLAMLITAVALCCIVKSQIQEQRSLFQSNPTGPSGPYVSGVAPPTNTYMGAQPPGVPPPTNTYMGAQPSMSGPGVPFTSPPLVQPTAPVAGQYNVTPLPQGISYPPESNPANQPSAARKTEEYEHAPPSYDSVVQEKK